MAKKGRQNPAAASEGGGFDMTPMIDVTFLLIIFFMCVTEMKDATKSQLLLPKAYNGEEDNLPVPGRIVLNVKADGVFEIRRQPYTKEALTQFLTAQAAVGKRDAEGFSETAVLIRADKDAEWGAVQTMMAACMEARLWKLAFSSKDPMVNK